jgi:hypothetical protein
MLIEHITASIGHDEILRVVMTNQRLRRVVTRAIIDDLADRVDSSSVDRNAARRLIRALGEIDAVAAVAPPAPRKPKARPPVAGAIPAFDTKAQAIRWAKSRLDSTDPNERSVARDIWRMTRADRPVTTQRESTS